MGEPAQCFHGLGRRAYDRVYEVMRKVLSERIWDSEHNTVSNMGAVAYRKYVREKMKDMSDRERFSLIQEALSVSATRAQPGNANAVSGMAQ